MARVLVVDSPGHLREDLLGQLRRLGHEANGADSALVALELVRRTPPNLLVLDYGVLGITGVRLFREALAPLGESRPAILFMASSPIGEVAAHVAPAVRVRFIQRPFEFGELARDVRALLSAG